MNKFSFSCGEFIGLSGPVTGSLLAVRLDAWQDRQAYSWNATFAVALVAEVVGTDVDRAAFEIATGKRQPYGPVGMILPPALVVHGITEVTQGEIMKRIVLLLAVITAQFAAGSALAADSGSKPNQKRQEVVKTQAPQASIPAAPTIQKMAIGSTLKLDGFEVVLNKVVQPGSEALGGNGFTEYNMTITNTSPDKELVMSNASLAVKGDVRPMVKDPDDIVNQDNSTGKTTAVNAGGAAVGFIGGMLGPIGSLVSLVGVNAAASKVLIDDPQKWHEEIKRRGFHGNDAGASIFPTETVTGSIWVKQAISEVADRIQLYMKQGGASRVVRLDLIGMPVTLADAKAAKAEKPE